ncbi:MAG: peptide-methionine (S)-S-oxide reductase MsrA [Xanthomonadales bacterium]|jgi:peptide-methionine (S)-S-oxide reductase|nr:peptide-methionine (S)-S-oxide reductase MsrA [Xanthomonadales bacterium]
MSERIAYFAAGCFWGVEDRFRKTPGVADAISGYMGGHVDNPAYTQVCNGDTGHTETVKVVFDDEQVSYSELLDLFFQMHNPTTLNRQGPDFGSQYRSAVFAVDEGQVVAVTKKIAELDVSGKWRDPVVTEVNLGGTFWPAEAYHQRYYEKNGAGFCKV